MEGLTTRVQQQLLLLAGCFNPAPCQGLLQPDLPLDTNTLLLCLLPGRLIPLPLLAALGVILCVRLW